MPSIVSQLVLCLRVLRAKDEDVFGPLLSSAAAVERRRHREDRGLEEESIQTISSCFQLDSQRALCLHEPLVEFQDVSPREGLNEVRVGRTW
jgi:hypothetical protein